MAIGTMYNTSSHTSTRIKRQDLRRGEYLNVHVLVCHVLGHSEFLLETRCQV